MELRQGCPLSPFLFFLCLDMLSRTLYNLATSDALKDYQPRPHGMSISHPIFADDLILMAKATRQNVMLLKNVVMDYCNQSNQKVNI